MRCDGTSYSFFLPLVFIAELLLHPMKVIIIVWRAPFSAARMSAFWASTLLTAIRLLGSWFLDKPHFTWINKTIVAICVRAWKMLVRSTKGTQNVVAVKIQNKLFYQFHILTLATSLCLIVVA